MKSLFLIALSNINRQKGQNFFIGLTIAVSALLFVTALGILVGLDQPFEKTFDHINGGHLLYVMDNKEYDIDVMVEWWQNQDEVEEVDAYILAPDIKLENIRVDGEKVDFYPWLVERPYEDKGLDRLIFLEGEEKPYPALGEIWIANSLANNTGVSLGDTLEIPTGMGLTEFTISAIVVDILSSSPMTNPSRMWIAPGSLPLYYGIEDISGKMVSIRLTDPALAGQMQQRFNTFIGGIFTGLNFSYEELKGRYLIIFQIAGFAMLIFSILSIITVILVLYTTVSGSIQREYRQIGVLKAIGFSPGDVKLSFIIQYVLISCISLPWGIITSSFLVPGVLSNLTTTLGITNPEFSIGIVEAAVVGLFFLLISLTVFIISSKAARIKPVDAIRLGEKGGESHSRMLPKGASFNPLFGKGVFSLALAAIFMEGQKRRSFFSALTIAFTAFLLLFSLNTVISLQENGKNLSVWGFANADFMISHGGRRFSLTHEELVRRLSREPGISEIYSVDVMNGFSIISADGNSYKMLANSDIYSKESWEPLKITAASGRNPETKDEICLAFNSARLMGYEIGDSVRIMMFGQEKSFTLVGIYQHAGNGGEGARMLPEAIWDLNPLYKMKRFYVKINDGVEKGQLIEELETKYGESIDIIDFFGIIQDGVEMYSSAIVGAFLFVCAIFLIITGATLFNGIVMEINERRKTFGILKNLGMTPLELTLIMVYKTLILAFIGTLMGIFGALFIGPVILNNMFSETIGLIAFPTTFAPLNPVFTMIGILLMVFVSSWFPASGISKIETKSLVTE